MDFIDQNTEWVHQKIGQHSQIVTVYKYIVVERENILLHYGTVLQPFM